MTENVVSILLLWESNKRSAQVFFNSLADFFLPRLCPACKNKLNTSEQFICDNCLSKLKFTSPYQMHSEYDRKFADDKLISDFHSLFIFEKDKEFQSVAHELKYNGKFKIGFFLGKLIALHLKEIIQEWNADLIIPVPLHSLKKAERGYNQSYFIAKGIKSVLSIAVSDKIVRRRRFTESQTKMNLVERKENIMGAFVVVDKNKVAGKRIILLDDVITTGATITECGRVLLESGAEKIFALSAAIAE